MRLLLDTNSLLWWLSGSSRLSAAACKKIADADSEVHVSAVSACEIAIKQAVGKLRSPDDLHLAIRENGFLELPIVIRHGLALANLPLHHRNPFDRILISQAQAERLTIVTADRTFTSYGVSILDAAT